jgi:hypothetical protein
VTLVNGSSANEGRLEVYHNNMWGSVCDDAWTPESTTTACKELGYPNGGVLAPVESFAPGTGVIWLDDVICTNVTASLELCPHNDWGVHNCAHSEDVGLICNI